MKTSAVLASALLSALAVAAPMHKRDYAYTTEIVTETVVVYTTVYDDNYVPEATTTPEGLFYEQPAVTSSAVAEPTYAAAPAPKPVEASSAPAPQAPAPTPTPAAVVTPTPAPVVEQPKEEPKEEPKPATSAYVAPAAASPAPAPAAPVQAPSNSGSSGSTSSGESFSDVDVTVYDNNGGFGACGTALYDTDMVAAIAKDAWNAAGGSTYDTMTGKATNPWCGQKITVNMGGEPTTVTIMDLCPGCSGHDIDLSWAAWKKASGTNEATRLKGSWSKSG